MKDKGVDFVETEDFIEGVHNADVVYMTRTQRERMKGLGSSSKDTHILDKNSKKYVKQDAVIMHPLPRTKELPIDVDMWPQAVYFKQIKYVFETRKQILIDLLS